MRSTFLAIILLLSVCTIYAQRDTIRLKKTARENRAIVTDRAPQAVYFQLGGSGPILSVNYDRRFAKKVNGAGFTGGIGFWGGTGLSIFSIPVSVNYLFGKRSDFLEVAGGATYISSSSDDFFSNTQRSQSVIFYHLNAGYRHQPFAGGFFFRTGFSPLFYNGNYAISYYLGFGHNF